MKRNYLVSLALLAFAFNIPLNTDIFDFFTPPAHLSEKGRAALDKTTAHLKNALQALLKPFNKEEAGKILEALQGRLAGVAQGKDKELTWAREQTARASQTISDLTETLKAKLAGIQKKAKEVGADAEQLKNETREEVITFLTQLASLWPVTGDDFLKYLQDIVEAKKKGGKLAKIEKLVNRLADAAKGLPKKLGKALSKVQEELAKPSAEQQPPADPVSVS